MGVDEYDGISHTFVYVDQPTSGIVKLFECPPTRQQPPLWVGSGIAAYGSINWDIDGAYDAVETLVEFFQPPGTLNNIIDQIAQQGPQIHIKDDIIDSLSGRFQTFADAGNEEVTQNGQTGLFALELRDSETIADVLERVAEISDGKLMKRDFRGTTIYEVDVPNFQGGPQQTAGVCVAKGNLFVAMNMESLERYLRVEESEEPLAHSTDYRRVSSHFPSETSTIGFSRPGAQLRPIYEMMRSGQMDAVASGEIDFSELPDFEEIAQYFGIAGSYSIPDDKGALVVNFSLKTD